MTTRELAVASEADAGEATRIGREMALAAGLSSTDAAHVATAVSEIALNQVRHAGGGTVTVRSTAECVVVEARDAGPGIADVEQALADGWSTTGTLGLGLPGARRLMDEFELESAPGAGTRVRMAKWLPGRRARIDTRRLAIWGAHAGRLEPVVEPWPGGLLFALGRSSAVAGLRADPAAPLPVLVERAGGGDLAIASFSGLDGRLVWRAEPPTSAVLHRTRLGRSALIAAAPRRRAETVGVRRGDVLAIASFPLGDGPVGAARRPADAAGAIARAAPRDQDPSVLVAAFALGTLEQHRRPPRPVRRPADGA